MENKFKKDAADIIKGILPAVFFIAITVVAVNTGGADIKEVPERVEASFKTQLPEATKAPEITKMPETQPLGAGKDKAVKKKKKKQKVKNKKNNIDIKELKNGKFTGIGTGFGGEIKSLVTIKDGKIISIKILSAAEETPSYFNEAKAVIPLIIDKQAYDVDTVSGATYSSNGIIESVKNALKLARREKATKKKTSTSKVKKEKTPSVKAESKKEKNKKTDKDKKAETSSPAGTSNLKDGLYTGTGTGFGGEIKVSVKIKKGKITKISILSAGFETPSYLEKAKGIIGTIIKKQSTETDAITGATYSSNGIKEAVNNALLKAVKKKEQDTGNTNKDNVNKDNTGTDNTNTNNDNNNGDNNDNNDVNNNTNCNEGENGEWVLVSETSNSYTYPVSVYCEPYTDDFEGYDIGFNIIITTEIIVEENVVKSTRTTTNNYVSAIELEQDTIDYVMETGNWSFLDMAVNGKGSTIGLFGQLLSNNSIESFDTVSGATCSSDAVAYGIKSTLADIKLGKTVVIS